MASPYHHSVSSTRKFGGVVDDYIAVHQWFDMTRSLIGDFRHRALRHHAQGIADCEQHFGVTLTNSDGRVIPVRWVGEQHVTEDQGVIPEAADWLRSLRPEPWMMRGAPVGMEDGEGGVPYKHRRHLDSTCAVCGGPAEALTEMCDLCAGRLAVGYLREEIVDGERVYRQWTREWVPGEILRRRDGGN